MRTSLALLRKLLNSPSFIKLQSVWPHLGAQVAAEENSAGLGADPLFVHRLGCRGSMTRVLEKKRACECCTSSEVCCTRWWCLTVRPCGYLSSVSGRPPSCDLRCADSFTAHSTGLPNIQRDAWAQGLAWSQSSGVSGSSTGLSTDGVRACSWPGMVGLWVLKQLGLHC